MVLVIIILAAWAVILGPSLLKRRARTGGDQSISHFHHQLQILEHSAPEPLVTPAYRLRAVDGGGTPTGITYPGATPPRLTVVGAKELPRPALAFLGEPAVDSVEALPGFGATATAAAPATTPATVPGSERHRGAVASDPVRDARGHLPVPTGRPRPPRDMWEGHAPPPVESDGGHRADNMARQRARRRRRDTLSVLAALFAVAVLVGAVTGSAAVWVLCALDAVALGAYVVLLVLLRRDALERERKLHYLDEGHRPVPVGAGGPSTRVSGRYAHPSNQQAIAR